MPIIQKRGMNAFFFFYFDIWEELQLLENEAKAADKVELSKESIKELVINAAKGKRANN